MYHIMIVDDEPNIANGLYELLQESLDIDMDIFRAYTGQEAIEKMLDTKVDIVILDIHLPDLNGIDVQNEIQRLWPWSKVIIHTGYDEFRYAQSAIRRNGVDYVLKTEGDQVLIDAVKKAIGLIEKEISYEDMALKAASKINSIQPLLREKYLVDLIDRSGFAIEELQRDFSEYDIQLAGNQPVLLLLGRVDAWPKDISAAERGKRLYRIIDIAAEYCACSAILVPVVRSNKEILWLIQPKPNETDSSGSYQSDKTMDRTLLFIQATLDSIQYSCDKLLDLSISFIVANSPCDWYEIASRCEMLRAGLEKQGASDEKIIMIERTIEEFKGDVDGSRKGNYQINRTLFRKINMLESILDSGHKQEFIESTTDIIRSIQEQRNISDELNIELFYTLLTAVLSYINRWGLEGKIAGAFDFSRLTNKQGMPLWDMVLVNVINMADACLSEKRNLVLNNNNKMLEYIRMYVKNNLDGDLSLTYFSKQLHFNPSYLSRLFRQMTGIRLSDYIIAEKLSKVKEQLKTSNRKIADIAASIGYDNPSHFSYFFKKHTGVNPQEFRDSRSDQ